MLLTLALLNNAVIEPAFAWKHTGGAWSLEDDNGETPGRLTRDWYMDDAIEDSLPEGYQEGVIEAAFQNWPEAAQCAAIGIQP